jgi:hypothetical protein
MRLTTCRLSVTTWSMVAKRQPVDDACRETGIKNRTTVSCSSFHACRGNPTREPVGYQSQKRHRDAGMLLK